MNKKTMFAIAFAAIAGPACSNDPAPPATDKPTLDTRPAHVTLTFYVDQEKAGTCSGVLLASRVVMTGAHCVAGKTAAWVKAPYANDQTTWSTKAVVYDWTDTATPESHPHHTDVAVLYLDDDITIPKYPTVSTSPVRDGGNVSIVRRGFKSGEKTRAFLKFAAAAKSARARGFPNDYQTEHDSKLVDTGGPAYAGDRVVGIVSGRGASTGSLYIARLDHVASWIGDQVIHAPQKTESESGSGGSTSSGGGAMPMGDGGKADGGMDAGAPKKIPTPPSGTMSDPKGTPQMPSGGGSMGGMGGSSGGGMGTMSGGSSGGGDHGGHGGTSGSSGSSGSTDDHGDHGTGGTSGANGTDQNNPCSCTTPDPQTAEHGDEHTTGDDTTSGGAPSGGENNGGGMEDCGEGMCSGPGTDYGDNGTGNVEGGDDGGWGGDYDSGGDYGDYGGDGYGDDSGGWYDGGGDYGD